MSILMTIKFIYLNMEHVYTTRQDKYDEDQFLFCPNNK